MSDTGEFAPDRAAIERAQLDRLNALLAALVPANIFYSQKFKDAGCADGVADLGDFTSRYPLTTKDELARDQLARPPYGSNLTFPIERYTRCHQTSGTSGPPLRWLDTPESWDWMLRLWEQVFRAAEVTSRDRVFCAFSFGPFIGFWMAFEAACRLGCLAIPGGGLSSAVRLGMILDHGVTVLCCTPTYALRLGEVAATEGIDLKKSKVRVILVAGEPGGSVPATRQRIESLWPGARVMDHHGMTEVGPVTSPCPARSGVLHIMERGYLAEIIDPQTLQAVPVGEAGELVLTTLARTGSPLLRYRTGDLVRALAPGKCACGRSELSLEGGILSRVDDMIVVRGVNVYPGAVEQLIRSCPGIAEYRARVEGDRALAELTLEIEPETGVSNPDELKTHLERVIQEALALRVRITLAAPGSLPRYEMKARRWVKDMAVAGGKSF